MANVRHSRSWGEWWLEPVPYDFWDLDTVETLEVQGGTVEEKYGAMALLVEGKADKLGVEATGWAVRRSGFLCTYSSE